jgi:hypothetical protein
VQKSDLVSFSVFLSIAQPGDQVILLPTSPGYEWNDTGYDNYFWRVRATGFVSGTPATGSPGDGYIQLLGYPSTRDRTQIIATSGFKGCLGGHPGSGDNNVGGIYIAIGNLTCTIPGAAAVKFGGPLNLSNDADYWRVVNNIFGDWDAEYRSVTEDGAGSAKQGGVAGHGLNLYIVGNNCRNIGGGQLNHGMYFDDGAVHGTLAYNWIHNCYGGNLVQWNANLGVGSINDWDVYGNLLGNGQRHGFNIANMCHNIRGWNNVVYNVVGAALRFAEAPDGAGTHWFYNTFVNFGLAGAGVPYNGAGIMVDNAIASGNTVVIEDNILVASQQTTEYTWQNGIALTDLTLRNNLYYGLAGTSTGGLTDSSPTFGDPLFTNVMSLISRRLTIAADDVPRSETAAIKSGGRTVDFTPLAGSPAEGAGVATAPDDDHHIFKVRPGSPTKGALEVLFTA